MEIGIIEIAEIFTILYLLYYYCVVLSFKFWKCRGVPGPEPILAFGTAKDVVLGKISIGDYIKREYKKYKHYPMFGIFLSCTPVLIINDPELIKDVLIKHFSTFSSRGNVFNEKIEPLSANLMNLEPARWKPLRVKQTSMFSSGKIKGMFHLVLECGNHLEKVIDKVIDQNNVIDCCKITTRFATDVIGNCFFGIDTKALQDEESQFHKIGQKFTNYNRWRAFKMRFRQIFPSLYNVLGFIMYDYEINDFFINTMTKTIEYRKNNNTKRGDFVDLLNELKDSNFGKLNGIELTDTLLAAQVFAFFFAGFDTAALTISHALYELALNQSVQNKLREEINDVFVQNDGKLEFENIKNMKYLDKVFNETLRKYPVVNFLSRETTSSFTFFGSNITIPKGTKVWIPLSGINENPDIYENPEIFNPERFIEKNIKERHASYYLPFGDGPRNCIAARFASIETKLAIVIILKKYKLDVCDNTPVTYKSNPRRFLLAPKNGLPLKFTKLN